MSEITGLQWGDLDREHRQLLVQRSVVNGRVDDVKTEYSHDHVPIHGSLLEVLLAWSEQCPETEEGWMFPNPLSNKPYYSTEIHKRYLRTSGCCVVPCPTCGVATGEWCVQSQPTANGKRVVIHEPRKLAAGKFADIGWHTFRHTYRSWLDETGAPMKVQQELMRHASHPDHDERVRTGDAGVEERSKRKGRADGAQALASERLKCRFSYWE